MSLPEEHFRQTKWLLSKIDVFKIANWLLQEGYYPEQYVLPPSFSVSKFKLKTKEYFEVTRKGKRSDYKPSYANLECVGYPKSRLTDRTFGIMEPKLYHDIVWNISNEWDYIVNHLFNRTTKIYSYSFPIPISASDIGHLSDLRVGRMIYEFIEMAENDLVAEAHHYKYIVKTDIKNFYPSIYTHSIAWALHGKDAARKDRLIFDLLGNKIDKLLQSANDGCTNGLPIGSALTDLIAEILAAAVDKEVSKEIGKKGIDFLGVRYKDDYRFLCNSRSNAESILKVLQTKLRDFNLSLNEGKSIITNLPEGLYRPWKSAYNPLTLKYKKVVGYKRFEETLLGVLKIDQENPDTGIIDRFLSELYLKDCTLKLSLKDGELIKVFSLLMMLKRRRAKSFPLILAIIEDLLCKYPRHKHRAKILASIEEMTNRFLNNQEDNLYDLLWLTYVIKANNYFKIKWPRTIKSPLLNSVKKNEIQFFKSVPRVDLFKNIDIKSHTPLSRYLAMFFRE